MGMADAFSRKCCNILAHARWGFVQDGEIGEHGMKFHVCLQRRRDCLASPTQVFLQYRMQTTSESQPFPLPAILLALASRLCLKITADKTFHGRALHSRYFNVLVAGPQDSAYERECVIHFHGITGSMIHALAPITCMRLSVLHFLVQFRPFGRWSRHTYPGQDLFDDRFKILHCDSV